MQKSQESVWKSLIINHLLVNIRHLRVIIREESNDFFTEQSLDIIYFLF